MTKITKSGDQYKIYFPKDILLLTGWDEKTEVILAPANPTERVLNKDTPIIIRRIVPRGDK